MMFGLGAIFGWERGSPPAAARERLASDEVPASLYAIGDVHGCLDELLRLEQMIIEDAAGRSGEKWIVLLGDYVDRGPASASVIAHLRGNPPAGFRRFCLAGNHEQLFADAMRSPRAVERWLALGGIETARSYGLSQKAIDASAGHPREINRLLGAIVPGDDLEWLSSLPVSLTVPGWIFVHAGVRAGVAFDDQSDDDLMWSRLPDRVDLQSSLEGRRLVHGHTPTSEPIDEPSRICVDTGSYATGRLTSLCIRDGRETSFLSTGPLAIPSRVRNAR
jgi:serine/threonine protein phosphatase 1